MVLCINANNKNSLFLHPVLAALLTESPLKHMNDHKKIEEKIVEKLLTLN